MDETGNEKRYEPTHCPWCDYPRTGLGIESCCPECGEEVPAGWLIFRGEPNFTRGGYFATPWRKLRWALVGLLVPALLLILVARSAPSVFRVVGPLIIAQLLVALVPLAARLFLREPKQSTLWISASGIGQRDDDLLTQRLRRRIAISAGIMLIVAGLAWTLWSASMIAAITTVILGVVVLIMLVVEWHRLSRNVEATGSSVDFFTPWQRVKSLSVEPVPGDCFRVRAKLLSRIESMTMVDIELSLDAVERETVWRELLRSFPQADTSSLRQATLLSASHDR